MNKLKTLLISIIVGLTVAVIAIAFTGPGTRAPGTGNPDFWLKSGNDVYYNPVGSGNVGVGTVNPTYKLDVQGGQINTSGGLCIAGDCKTLWSQVAGTNHWTLSGSSLYSDPANSIGIGVINPSAKLDVRTTGNGIGLHVAEGRTSGDNYGIYIDAYGNGATGNTAGRFSASGGTTNFGIMILDVPVGADNYALYSGTSAQSYFAGNVGIGAAIPTYKLDVQNGQINTSGGLCIAGDCKTAWNQVGGGSSQWTTSGSNIYYNSGNVGVGTASLDPNYKITTAGGGIKAVSSIASQPAGYFDNPSGYSLITGSGNVGIGTASPGTNKLEVVGGPIKATGGLIIETRTSDPTSPVVGQIWLRTDL